MEAIHSLETSATICKTIQCHISEDRSSWETFWSVFRNMCTTTLANFHVSVLNLVFSISSIVWSIMVLIFLDYTNYNKPGNWINTGCNTVESGFNSRCWRTVSLGHLLQTSPVALPASWPIGALPQEETCRSATISSSVPSAIMSPSSCLCWSSVHF